jgi:RNA polymerase sigma-70 factor (ECF subfamily)
MTLRLVEGRADPKERLLSAMSGDAGARNWLVSHYTPPVYRFCLRMLRNEEDAREITQESLLRALRALDRYDPERSFSTWVLRIARNACIDAIRRRKPQVNPVVLDRLASESPSPLEETERDRTARRLHLALDALSVDHREILVLYHFEHFKYREIAEILEIPLGTVMNRIFRARRRLREIYEEDAA